MKQISIKATDEQVKAFYERHMRSIYFLFGTLEIERLGTPEFTPSRHEDSRLWGFVRIQTNTGKTIECDMRDGIIFSVNLKGFKGIEYRVSRQTLNSTGCREFYETLAPLCERAIEDFWNGKQI